MTNDPKFTKTVTVVLVLVLLASLIAVISNAPSIYGVKGTLEPKHTRPAECQKPANFRSFEAFWMYMRICVWKKYPTQTPAPPTLTSIPPTDTPFLTDTPYPPPEETTPSPYP